MNARILTCMIAVIVAVAVSGGCMEKSGVEVADVEQVRGYAGPVTENILVAMNEGDYAMYSEDFDQTTKRYD
jgi:hypothetical protein